MYRLHRHCKLCSEKVDILGFSGIRKRQLTENKNWKTIGELASAYKPHEIEGSHYDESYFVGKPQSDEKPYSLILPPPNITGTLHLGHALTASIQDVLVKWHRMHGRQTMWVPGLDHAGIATQVVVEKKLWKERRLTRHALGRENFEKEVWKWKQEKSSTIIQQLRRLNIDINWDKEVYTMDSQRSKAVVEAFIRLFDEGLIYRADHLVNWSCALQSAISDVEVEHVEVDGATDLSVPGYDKPVRFGVLTRFAYKIDNSDDEIVVATTRPETMLGDVAVAVNPKDSRYTHLIGKHLHHPFRNDFLPIVADDFVDSEFGTGAVKITPAHDPTDFDVGKRLGLKSLSIINEKGYLTENCGEFEGSKRFDARETIINQLAQRKLLRGSDGHKMTVPICSRSKDIVEFLIKPQWFLSCSEMAEKSVQAVGEGQLKIEPENFEKIWYQWLENIRDWCVSRQLWWGHRIPAYSCRVQGSSEKEAVWVAADNIENAQIKASKILNCEVKDVDCIQDEDVLDTWFSSALQPFAVFGWPEQTADLKKYFPLSIMETGHDILFFWVARMVMLGTQLTGTLPFKHVLLHGIICDRQGRKMSKSLGNVIAPDDVIDGATLEQLKAKSIQNFLNGTLSIAERKKATEEQQKMFPSGIPKCGADSLRFTLLSHNVKSHVINFDIAESKANAFFGNKIWQATKFTFFWLDKMFELYPDEVFLSPVENYDQFSTMDRWILSKLTHMLKSVTDGIENHDFYIGTYALKQFLYYEFCDIYLESVKSNLRERTAEAVSKNHCVTLLTCLDLGLRALAPYMPVLAQHLHQHLPRIWGVGVDKSFPKLLDLRNEPLEREVESVMEIIIGIRRLKQIFHVTFKYGPEVFLAPTNLDLANKYCQVIKDLSNLQTFHILDGESSKPEINELVEDVVGQNKIYLIVPEELRKNFDVDASKMNNKKEKLLKELDALNDLINAKDYQARASAATKEAHLKKVSQITEKISRIDYIQSFTR